MAVPFDFAPLVTRIREVAQGAGSVRVVSTDARMRAYPSDAAQEAARALQGPGIEVVFDDRVHPQKSLAEISRVKMIDLGLSVRIEWPVASHELEDTQRDAIRAAAWSFEEELRAALQWPGNLRATTAGALTYVRGACLDRHVGTRLEREDWRARRYSILTRYRCFVDAPQETA